MSIDRNRCKSAGSFMWLSIDNRLTDTNQHQLSNWDRFISIDWLVFRWSIFVDCVHLVHKPIWGLYCVLLSAFIFSFCKLKGNLQFIYTCACFQRWLSHTIDQLVLPTLAIFQRCDLIEMLLPRCDHEQIRFLWTVSVLITLFWEEFI